MARPERRDVDYFPFIIKNGRTLFILETKYQAKGTGVFTNLMRFLSRIPDHHFQIKNEADKLYLCAELKCDVESGMDMLEIMSETQKIDAELWKNKKVIASQDFLLSIQDAYVRRHNNIITIEQIREKYGVNDDNNPVNDNINPPKADINTQSKVKYSKVKKTYSPTSSEVRLSELLFTLIRERDDKFKEPNYQKWATDIDRLIRIDGRSPIEVEEVIEWCQSDDFWQNNILSPAKLRSKFTQLKLKKGKGGGEYGIFENGKRVV